MEMNCVPISFDLSRYFFFKKMKSNKRKGCYHVQFMLQCCQLYYSESMNQPFASIKIWSCFKDYLII